MRFKWALAGLAFALALRWHLRWLGRRDGVTAYERQDYATARRLFEPLADQGEAFADVGSMYALVKGCLELRRVMGSQGG